MLHNRKTKQKAPVQDQTYDPKSRMRKTKSYRLAVIGSIVFALVALYGFMHARSNILFQSQSDLKDSLSLGYTKYADEISHLRTKGKEYCEQGIACMSDDLEMEITYMRLREVKPELIWEISPMHGYSTFWILSAIKANGIGTLISFDVNDKVLSTKGLDRENWEFVKGDFRKTYQSELEAFGAPDYLFLDSYHSVEFGMFYIEEMFPTLTKQNSLIYVSLHDVFNPTFWTDGSNRNLRKKAKLPEWLANEEGQPVINWIAFNPKCASGAFTAARAWLETYDEGMLENIVQDRETKIKEKHIDIKGIDISRQNNPTMYFKIHTC